MKTGDSGATIVTAKKADDSELLRRLVTEDADERMPFEGDAYNNDKPIKKEEKTAATASSSSPEK